MGQRANYILIENNNTVIHYSHWRANCIASDLYLGENRFIKFVRSCKIVDVLLNEIWIEGCVIVNIDKQALYFWSLELEITSAIDLYLKELQDKWKGWSISLLYNKMYDVGRILGIDYISQQDQVLLPMISIDGIVNNEDEEFNNSLIIIKATEQTYITRIEGFAINRVLNYGENVIDILLSKKQYELPNEGGNDMFETLIIDTVNKKILVDKSEFGLWEQSQHKWNGYSFTMGDFGYIGTLKLADINTAGLVMSPEKIKSDVADLVRYSESFDSVGMAKLLMQESKDIEFSQDFFDNTHPKPTAIEKISKMIKKITNLTKH